MPHMSNLPWMNMYFFLLLIVMLSLSSLSFPQTILYSKKNSMSPNKNKNKWTW